MGATNNLPIGIVILAAGASSRLGKPKQLLKFRGKSLIRLAAENAVSSGCQNVVVALGANIIEAKAEIADLPLEIVVNENWASGMSSSVKTGLLKLLEIQPKLSAVLVQLCDQPLVDSAVLKKLTTVYQQTSAPIVASEYAETIGVPAIFAASVFEEILSLPAETGAKKIIQKHLDSVVKVAISEAEIDVDTIADYEKLLEKHR